MHYRRKTDPTKSTQIKTSSEQAFLSTLHWVPDSCHNEEGRSSRKLLKEVRVNAVFFVTISDFKLGLGAFHVAYDLGGEPQPGT